MTPTPLASLYVPGRPKPAERPRMTRRGRAYTPAATIEAENQIADAWRDLGLQTFTQPLFLVVDYDPDGQLIRLLPTEHVSPLRSDVDNLLKTTMDGLQKGGAFLNDKLVHEVWAAKLPTGSLADYAPSVT